MTWQDWTLAFACLVGTVSLVMTARRELAYRRASLRQSND